MEQQIINVYSFDELKPEIKENVLDKFREINTDYDWYEFLIEDFKMQLEENGLSFENLNFDLYDRKISFYKLIVENEDKFLNSFLSTNDKILNSLDENFENFEFKIESDDYGNLSIDFDSYDNDDILNEIPEEVINLMEEKGTDFLKDKLREFLKRLTDEYDYLLTDEAVEDTLISNEYQFLESGRVW